MKIFAQIYLKYRHDPVFWLMSGIRIIFALSILRWPVFGWIATATFDIVDGQVYVYRCKLTAIEYHVWDKLLDVVYFSAMLIVGWRMNWFPWVITILFIYRLIGQLIFWLTQNDQILLIFPNIFETLWLYAAGRSLWFPNESYLSLSSVMWFGFLVFVKLCQEWGLHYFGKKGLFKWSRDHLRFAMPWLAR